MSESFDPRARRPGDDGAPDLGEVGEEALEVESAPRRAASAELVVSTAVGSRAMLREAMDPANQSLRDALRLSFRVLQVVILLLVVLFLFSGFQTVESQQTGVMLRWGRIVGEPGAEALEPGAQFSIFPYPIGEFVLLQDKGRQVDLGDAFWPRIRPNQSFEQAVEASSTDQLLRPGPRSGNARGDGSLITAEGDIAHLRLRAQYEIESPVEFLRSVENVRTHDDALDGDRLVELALLRSVVHAAAKRELSDLVDFGDDEKAEIRERTQRLLDGVGSGIRLAEIEPPMAPTPAFAIRKAENEVQQRRTEAGQTVEKAREAAQRELLAVAGSNYPRLLALIAEYERVHDAGDDDAATRVLGEINLALEDDATQGQVAEAIYRANAYRSLIESSLGNEARRFATVLASYRRNPALVTAELWSAARSAVLGAPDVELVYVPDDVGNIKLMINGSEDVADLRRKMRLDRRERTAATAGLDLTNPRLDRAADIALERRAGRQLERDASSKREGE